MARPYSTRAPRRVQVAIAPDAQPRLDVVAPLNVRTPDASSSPLAGLVQALNIAAPVAAKNIEARSDQDFAEGVADEQLDKADLEKAQRSKAYANGAFQTVTLEQYHAAEQKVIERASTELDHSLPLDDQIHIIDGWMKSELGPMVTDPRAKVLFAERYQEFINQTAASIQKNQLEANAKAAEDTTLTDIATTIQRTGGFTPDNWNENFHRLYSQTGDAVGARKTLVGAVMQEALNAASRGEDYKRFRDMIPTEVIGPDGAKLPGPMRSPEIQALVNQTMDKAEGLYDKFHTNDYAGRQASAFVDMNDMVNDGAPLTLDTFKEKGYSIGNKPEDLFSPERAASLIDQAATVRARMNAQKAQAQSFDAAYAATGRMADMVGYPGGPENTEQRNDWALNRFQNELMARGVPPEGLVGKGLVENPDAVNYIAMRTAQEGVPYAPLKTTLNSINPAAAGDVQARLAAYKTLKAKNLSGMYVSDDAALVYEAAIGAEESGADKAGVQDTLHKMGDKDTATYVAAHMPAIRKSIAAGITLKDSGLFTSSLNSNNTLTAAYINGKFQSLATLALSKGLSEQAAKDYAVDRIQQTHSLLHVGDSWMMLPNSAVPDPRKATAALDWYTSQLPKLAIARGIPEDEELTVKPVLGRGNSLTFQVFRAGGVTPLEATTFTLPGLLQTYYRANPQATAQSRAAQAQQRHKVFSEAPLAAPGSTAGLISGP